MQKKIVFLDIKGLDPLRDNPDLRYAARHLAESKFQMHGICRCDQYRDGILIAGGYPEPPNTFTTQGIAKMLNIMFFGATPVDPWYVGIFKNDVTPALGNTAAVCLGASGTYGECQDSDYDDPITNKPEFVTASTSTAAISNTAAKAAFTMAADFTVYGAFLGSLGAKTATSGTLMCGKRFDDPRNVKDNDLIYVEYTISVTTS